MDKNMGKRLCRRKTEGWDRDVGLEWLGDTANSRNCLKAKQIKSIMLWLLLTKRLSLFYKRGFKYRGVLKGTDSISVLTYDCRSEHACAWHRWESRGNSGASILRIQLTLSRQAPYQPSYRTLNAQSFIHNSS